MGSVFYKKEEEDMSKCRKHPLKNRRFPSTGVCPLCLRERLLQLCPDCATVRPCGCHPTNTTTTTSCSSSSSSFSLSSSSDIQSIITSGGVGVTGRMSTLIDTEPAFQRSRSAAFPFLYRSKISNSSPRKWFWNKVFKKQKDEEVGERKVDVKMVRSKSVGVIDKDNNGKVKGRGGSWYFPSPIKAFRQSKNSLSSKFYQERSPLCRG